MEKRRKTVLVLFGGCSTEYEVSLQSAYAVLTHMDRVRYEVMAVGIDRNGQWYWYRGEAEEIAGDRWREGDCTPVVVSPDRKLHGILVMDRKGIMKKTVDAALPVLHGKNGEDGTVQGALALAGIPVAGCGTLCSALCMDKDMAHRVAREAGVRTPRQRVFGRYGTPCTVSGEASCHSPQEKGIREAAGELGYPLFVKPVRSGSSLGITRVSGAEELEEAVQKAFEHDDSVILEEEIRGFEVGCAILGSRELTVGAVDEIELSQGFFDYTEKYSLKTSSIHVPARIGPEKTEEVKNAALRIYRALKCSGFARVDLFLTEKGEVVFNEVNTIPGMTVHSRFPKMMESAGISLEETLRRLLADTFGETER